MYIQFFCRRLHWLPDYRSPPTCFKFQRRRLRFEIKIKNFLIGFDQKGQIKFKMFEFVFVDFLVVLCNNLKHGLI